MLGERTMLEYHLKYNHFPPHSDEMIDTAMAALEIARSGDLDAEIELPDGIEHRRYGTRVPVTILLDSLHIDRSHYMDDEGMEF